MLRGGRALEGKEAGGRFAPSVPAPGKPTTPRCCKEVIAVLGDLDARDSAADGSDRAVPPQDWLANQIVGVRVTPARWSAARSSVLWA
jgi:hypothetical protein